MTTNDQTKEERWHALETRDKTVRDAFTYAVKTTGVYCRPLCGSRLPRRDNVEFFGSTRQAEAAGYRACKNCKPDQPLIRYAIAHSTLGLILIAATANGVCAVEFGPNRKTLIANLRTTFPEAKLAPADSDLETTIKDVLALIKNPDRAPSMRFDAAGTDFQKSVWQALAEVPRGETRTYSQLAASIGQPRASRAVAQACAANKLAVIVPCHRIVRQDGTLSGYRWGADRKRALLAREGVELAR